MMRQMRENTKWIMLITAAAFVALMVFEWGMDASGGAFGMSDVGRVGGTAVSVEQYQATYRNVYDQVSRTQDGPISSQQNREIEDMAWDEVVTQILIQKELERRGIRVSDDEIRDAARYSPPPDLQQDPSFQTNGQFDLDKYHEFLASASADRFFMQQLEQYYREVIPRSKLMRQLTAGIYVSDAELWREWKEQNEQVAARYLALDPQQRISRDDVEVSEGEIAQYYEENRDEFAIPARAEARYVSLSKTPAAADSADALERAREARQELLEGVEFAEVAARESGDEETADQGGALGTVTRSSGDLQLPLEEAIFTLPVGELSEPVETGLGYHVVEVLSRDGDSAEARHILIPLERTDDSEFRLLTRADSLEMLAENQSLDEAAEVLGLQVREGDLTEDFPILPGVGRAPEGAHWIFEEMAAPGAVSEVFESTEAFYVLELTRYSPATHQGVSEAAPAIRETLRLEKKLERAVEEGREHAQALRDGVATLEELSERHGLTLGSPDPFSRVDFVPGLGRQNRAIGTAFGLPEGAVSEPIRSDGNVFIIEVVERIPADREEWEVQKEIQRAIRLNEIRQERLDQWIDGLRESVRIVDRRAEVFEMQEDMADQPQMPMVF